MDNTPSPDTGVDLIDAMRAEAGSKVNWEDPKAVRAFREKHRLARQAIHRARMVRDNPTGLPKAVREAATGINRPGRKGRKAKARLERAIRRYGLA